MSFTWVYMSRALKAYDVAELDLMCQQFALRNQANGITGVLMKIGDHFVQVLEGEEDALLTLVSKLLQDERHTEFRTLYRGPISKRRFPKWSMRMMHLDRCYALNPQAVTELRRLVRTALRSTLIDDPQLTRDAIIRMLMTIPRVIALQGTAVPAEHPVGRVA